MSVIAPATSRTERIKLIERLAEARVKRDYAGFESCFTEDASFWILGRAAFIPFSGRRRGKGSLTDALKLMDSTLVYLDFKYDEAIVDGAHAAVRWFAWVRNLGTGSKVRMKGFAHLRFDGALICEFTYFHDTQTTAALIGHESA